MILNALDALFGFVPAVNSLRVRHSVAIGVRRIGCVAGVGDGSEVREPPVFHGGVSRRRHGSGSRTDADEPFAATV